MADPESEFQIGGIGVMLEVDYDARLCMRVMGRIAAFESIAYGPSAQLPWARFNPPFNFSSLLDVLQ